MQPMETVTNAIWSVLDTIIDPELGLPITDLGLITEVSVREGDVAIEIVPTTPVCPLGEYLAGQIRQRVSAIAGVTTVAVSINRTDVWTRDRLSLHARDVLGINR